MNTETWKPIRDYEGLYEISSRGNVKALEKTVHKGKCHRSWEEHILRTAVDNKGYLRTSLSRNGRSRTVKVHRLVAEAFIPNPENKPQVNHIDGNKQNNAVENLEWCTRSENVKHSYIHKLKRSDGEHNSQHKLTLEDVRYIRKVHKVRDPEFGSVALGKKFGVHRKTISRIVNGKLWKDGDSACQM